MIPKKSLDALEGVDVRRLLEHSGLPIEIAVALADVWEAARPEEGERKLIAHAQVGGTIFHPGVKESLVIGRAQREYVYQHTPEKEAERLARIKGFVDSLQLPPPPPPGREICDVCGPLNAGKHTSLFCRLVGWWERKRG